VSFFQQKVFSSHKWLNLTSVDHVYNSWDCLGTARLRKELLTEAEKVGQLQFYNDRVWPLVEPVMAMQRRGIPVNAKTRANVKRALSLEIGRTEAPLRAELGLPDGSLTPNHKRHLLFEKLGLKVPKMTKSGPSIDQDSLLKVLKGLRKKDEHARPFLEACFHVSRLSTLHSRYLNFPIIEGRMYPTVKPFWADTGRWAYADPPVQQWPWEIRHIVEAPPGHVILTGDYSQLEARILAILAGDGPSLQVFASGDDLHIQNALDLFGWTMAEWSALGQLGQQAARNTSKGFLYGISYGGEAETMRAKLYCPCPVCKAKAPSEMNVTKEEMQQAQTRWYMKHPAVAAFFTELIKEVFKTHSYTNPFGQTHTFFAPQSEAARKARNNPMQSTASQIINNSVLSEPKWPWLHQMHDAMYMLVPEGDALGWAKKLKGLMERPVPELDGTVFPVSVEMGKTWGSLEHVSV
jgi:DNA polymerase-1